MIFGNLLITVFCTYYCNYVLSFIYAPKQKLAIQTQNKKLNKLREVNKKSLKEQKMFLDTKFPKRIKVPWTTKRVLTLVLKLALFIIIFKGYQFMFSGLVIPIWIALLIIMICPILLNKVLRKFGLERNDISVFFK